MTYVSCASTYILRCDGWDLNAKEKDWNLIILLGVWKTGNLESDTVKQTRNRNWKLEMF